MKVTIHWGERGMTGATLEQSMDEVMDLNSLFQDIEKLLKADPMAVSVRAAEAMRRYERDAVTAMAASTADRFPQYAEMARRHKEAQAARSPEAAATEDAAFEARQLATRTRVALDHYAPLLMKEVEQLGPEPTTQAVVELCARLLVQNQCRGWPKK